MEQKKTKGHLYRSLQAMSIVPLLILGLIITLFSYQTLEAAMHEEIHTELKNMANSVILTYDLLYPGDYHLEGTESYDLYKGDKVLTYDYTVIDKMKEDTQIDITVFYQDTRILTTLFNNDNIRIIGTGANPRIINEVLLTDEPQFYTNTVIGGVNYFAYYTPLHNADGTVIGMVYAGKPCTEVNAAVRRAVLPIILIALCSMVIVGLLSSSYTHKLITSLQNIRTFLSKVSTGNLWVELDPSVLRRNDELSEMGHSALYMQRSLRNLVEQDTLTGINNRRFADKRLAQMQAQADVRGTSFVVAIGDIDFFKSVNDTYGHDGGDVVLKKIAVILKKHMAGKGFVARWGGEEFLFVYDNMKLDTAKNNTEALLNEIRDTSIPYEGQFIRVTMTFGLAEGCSGTDVKELVQTADQKLYEGKENGRNRVVI